MINYFQKLKKAIGIRYAFHPQELCHARHMLSKAARHALQPTGRAVVKPAEKQRMRRIRGCRFWRKTNGICLCNQPKVPAGYAPDSTEYAAPEKPGAVTLVLKAAGAAP